METNTRVCVKFQDDSTGNKLSMYRGTITNVRYDVLFDDGDFVKNMELNEDDYKNKHSDMEWHREDVKGQSPWIYVAFIGVAFVFISWCVEMY